jgi:flagellin-like hook-associated protein FlgL
MEKALWGKRIADKIHAGENQIDEAIRSTMNIIAEVQSAQADMNVSAVATDPSIAKLVDALSALQQARTSLVAGHRRLEKLGETLDMRTVAWGVGKPLGLEQDEVMASETRRVAG